MLLRLPIKSVIKFKRVSKDWNNFISRTEFRRCHQSRHHKTSRIGFVYHPIRIDEWKIEHIESTKFICTSNIDKNAELDLSHDLQEVVGSSKGLLLLSPSWRSFYMYDTLTGKHVVLPKTLEEYEFRAVGFICKEREQNFPKRPNKNDSYFTYKVVLIRIHNGSRRETMFEDETYSSETEKWHKSTMTVASGCLIGDNLAKVFGDVLHWENCGRYIIVYDPKDPTGRAKLIETRIFDRPTRFTISGTQDGCLLGTNKSSSVGINVWALGRKNETEKYLNEDIISRNRWTLIISISFIELAQSLLDSRPEGLNSYEFVGIHAQYSIIIYLKPSKEFISYNLHDKRVEAIISKAEGDASLFKMPYFNFEWPSWPCLL